MNYNINSIIRKSTRNQSEPFRLISASTHESFETIWCKANIEVYSFNGGHLKSWNKKFRPLPKNYNLLSPVPVDQNTPIEKRIELFLSNIPKDINFDAIVVQNFFAHWQEFLAISQQLNIPLIEIQHCLPNHDVSSQWLNQMKQRPANKKVFITDYSRDRWGYNSDEAQVIRHAVDIEKFCPSNIETKPYILTVANEFRERNYFLGFDLWEKVTKDLPRKNVGNCLGLSKAAETVDELIFELQSAAIFLNTSQISPVPMSLLEAASCGKAIITTGTAEIPFFFTHGENCLMSNDPNELRKYCIELLNDPARAYELGQNARKMIMEKCHPQRFVAEWNQLLEETCK